MNGSQLWENEDDHSCLSCPGSVVQSPSPSKLGADVHVTSMTSYVSRPCPSRVGGRLRADIATTDGNGRAVLLGSLGGLNTRITPNHFVNYASEDAFGWTDGDD